MKPRINKWDGAQGWHGGTSSSSTSLYCQMFFRIQSKETAKFLCYSGTPLQLTQSTHSKWTHETIAYGKRAQISERNSIKQVLCNDQESNTHDRGEFYHWISNVWVDSFVTSDFQGFRSLCWCLRGVLHVLGFPCILWFPPVCGRASRNYRLFGVSFSVTGKFRNKKTSL